LEFYGPYMYIVSLTKQESNSGYAITKHLRISIKKRTLNMIIILRAHVLDDLIKPQYALGS
jgi:hypothetical protein